MNQTRSGFRSPLERFCGLAGSIEVRFGTLAHNQLQSLTATQNAGNTLVQGVPGGFVPLNQANATPKAGETIETGCAEM